MHVPTIVLPPLTHHEIFTRVAPFARAGYQVDLAATDRAARRLVFKPRLREDTALPPVLQGAPLVEVLALDCARDERVGLQRTLTTPDGRQALLEGEGRDSEALLAAFEAVPPSRQFLQAAGCVVPLQHRLLDPRVGEAPALTLRRAQAALPGLALTMTVSSVSGYAAELDLTRAEAPGAPRIVRLPADFLEVLGGIYAPLTTHSSGGWNGSVELRGAGAQRGADAEARLAQMIEHITRTLGAPPPAFHRRHRLARWGIAARSTWPILLAAAVVWAGLWLQQSGSAGQSVLGVLANIAPPLLLGAAFLRREMPRIGLPRVPRVPRADAWTPGPG